MLSRINIAITVVAAAATLAAIYAVAPLKRPFPLALRGKHLWGPSIDGISLGDSPALPDDGDSSPPPNTSAAEAEDGIVIQVNKDQYIHLPSSK